MIFLTFTEREKKRESLVKKHLLIPAITKIITGTNFCIGHFTTLNVTRNVQKAKCIIHFKK